MSSSPRFTRGTSVIAALVFAALLGAVALSLNAFNSNSANTAALPAQAAAAASGSGGSGSTSAQIPTCDAVREAGSTPVDPTDSTKQACVCSYVPTENNPGKTTYYYQLSYTVSTANGQVTTTRMAVPSGNPVPESTQCQVTNCQQGQDSCSAPTTGPSPLSSTSGIGAGPTVSPDTTSPSSVLQNCTGNSADGYSCTGSTPQGVQSALQQTGLGNYNCSYADAEGTSESVVSCSPSANPTTGGTPDTTATYGCTAGASGASYSCGSQLQAINQANQLNQQGLNCSVGADGVSVTCSPTNPGGPNQGGGPNYTLPSSAGAGSNVECYNDDNGTQSCYPANQQDLNNLQSQGYTCTAETGGGSDSGGTDATCTKNTTQSPTLCNGQISSSATCSTTTPPPPGTGTPTITCGPGTVQSGNSCLPQTKTNTSQTSGSPLSSLLSGLARGLTQQQPCYTTTQNPYGTSYTMVPTQVLQSNGTYATVYVQQPTTVASPYGTTQPCGTTAPIAQPLTQAQAPYGVGSNGVACPAPAQIQQCPTGQTAEPVSSTGNGCTTGYQCVPSSSATNSTLTTPPTAQLSCTPQVADVGESVAISYSCGNATGSSGSGFSTNNQVSGTATSSISKPPAGTNTANFGLTCNNNGQTANAQCSVQINAPAIDFVANPSSVQLGSTATIGWVTAGMQSCVVSSPQDASFTSANASSNNPNGAVQTDPITQQTEYDLTCQTLGGQTKTASTTVTIATSTAPTQTQDITVSSSADGATVNHGSQVTIKWSDPSPASGSAIAIWLVDINTQEATAVIASQQAASGSYVWNIPNPSDSCNPDSYAPCASNLVAGRSYGIEATLYTPQNAYLGVPSQAPANAVAPTYTDFGYTPNPFTIGQ